MSRSNQNEHLDWQMAFLRASLERYDTGFEPEAIRVAHVIRILCYDHGKSSRSLLGQLNFKNIWSWVDTARPEEGWTAPYSFLRVEIPVGRSARLVAPCESHSNRKDVRSDFDSWWSGQTVITPNHQYRRHEIILKVSNQDGGAHVDPTLDRLYWELSHGDALGLPGRTANPETVARTPVWEIIRQIAYEVQATAHLALPDRFGPPTKRPPDQTPRTRIGNYKLEFAKPEQDTP